MYGTHPAPGARVELFSERGVAVHAIHLEGVFATQVVRNLLELNDSIEAAEGRKQADQLADDPNFLAARSHQADQLTEALVELADLESVIVPHTGERLVSTKDDEAIFVDQFLSIPALRTQVRFDLRPMIVSEHGNTRLTRRKSLREEFRGCLNHFMVVMEEIGEMPARAVCHSRSSRR